MQITDAIKKRLALNSCLLGDYPLPDAIKVEGNFEDLITKIKDPLINNAIIRAVSFQKNEIPNFKEIKSFNVILSKEYSIFGNKIECPGAVILDLGNAGCPECPLDTHVKLVAIFNDLEVLYFDYLVHMNEILQVDNPKDFWNSVIHEDFYEEPIDPFEVLSEEDEKDLDINSLEIRDDPKRLGLLKFLGRPWSYSTRITENDKVKDKISRAPKELEPIKKELMKIINEIPANCEISSFHFTKGWVETKNKKRFLVPPFFIFYVGSSKCECCQSLALKYVAVFEDKSIFINYDLENGAILELHPEMFWDEEIDNSSYNCH